MSRLTLTLALSNIFITATSSYCSCSRSCKHTHTHTLSLMFHPKGHTQTLLKHLWRDTAASRHLIFERESLHVHTHETSLHQEGPVLLSGHDVKDHILEPADYEHTHTHSQYTSIVIFVLCGSSVTEHTWTHKNSQKEQLISLNQSGSESLTHDVRLWIRVFDYDCIDQSACSSGSVCVCVCVVLCDGQVFDLQQNSFLMQTCSCVRESRLLLLPFIIRHFLPVDFTDGQRQSASHTNTNIDFDEPILVLKSQESIF